MTNEGMAGRIMAHALSDELEKIASGKVPAVTRFIHAHRLRMAKTPKQRELVLELNRRELRNIEYRKKRAVRGAFLDPLRRIP